MTAFFIIGITVFSLSAIWFAIALALWIYADAKARTDNPVLWLLVVLISNIIGLIVYLAIGRDKTKESPGRFKGLLIASAICFVISIPIYVISLVNFVVYHS